MKLIKYVGAWLTTWLFSAAGNADEVRLMNKIKAAFASITPKLTLTEEQKQSGVLRLLDLEMTLKQDHVGSKFAPKIKLLPSYSAHTKLLTNSIASGCITLPLKK